MTENLKSLKYLNFIISPIDNLCNLDCRYCYSKQNIKDGKFTSKDLTNLPISKWFPGFLSGLKSLSFLKTITFTWHGGEPLLLPDKFYVQVVGLQKKLLDKKFKYNNVIQTNGTLLTEERALFFLKLGFDIGVSIDGPDFEHNRQRFNDKGLFEKVKNNLFDLSKSSVPFAVFMVVHEGNVHSEKEIFSFLKKLSPQNGVSFIPRFNTDSHLAPEEYSRFLKSLFDLWWPAREPYIAILENFISGLEGKIPRFCFLNDRCGVFVSLDSRGTLYSTCQPRDEVKVGRVEGNNLKKLISMHGSKVKEIIKGIKNEKLCDSLGGDSMYDCFLGKGCLKRLAGSKDPYIESFAKVIKHIEKNIS